MAFRAFSSIHCSIQSWQRFVGNNCRGDVRAYVLAVSHKKDRLDPPDTWFVILQSYRGYCYANVKRWTKNISVKEKDLVLVPIHCHGNHWRLVIINLKLQRFEWYDSLRLGPDQVCLPLLCIIDRW